MDDLIDLGKGHKARVVFDSDEPIFLAEYHKNYETGEDCGGSVPLKPSDEDGWELKSIEPLDLSPSIDCDRCSSHGNIIKGEWTDSYASKPKKKVPKVKKGFFGWIAEKNREFWNAVEEMNEKARNAFDDGPPRPHQDATIMHAPGVCRLCDQFPNRQKQWRGAFTKDELTVPPEIFDKAASLGEDEDICGTCLDFIEKNKQGWYHAFATGQKHSANPLTKN